jgi:hypothetical protein
MNIAHISISRKSVWEQCMLLYKYKYHLKTPSPIPEPEYFAYGKVVHRIAEEYCVQKGKVLMDEIARETPGIVRVLDDVAPVRFPVWLVSHRELRTSRRIRVVFEALAEGLAVDR